MEKRTFRFEGKDYSARISMGALREFRKETGKDFLKIQKDLTGEDLGVMLWASIKRQARVDGVDFPYGCDDFLDRVEPDDVSAWYVGTGQAEPNAPEDGDESKKKTIPE